MTTIECLNPPLSGSRTGAISALWRKLFSGRRHWGVADQVLISGANFLTMVYTGKGLAAAAFGQFVLVYNVLLFVNMFQIALVSQPHNVLGAARRNASDYRNYTASTAASQIALTLVETFIALAFVALAHARGWACEALLLALVPAVAAWSLQEFFRRILYTEGRIAAAYANDVIAYGVQAVWIVALWWLDLGKPDAVPHWLTGPSALYALAITSAIAAALGCWQTRASLFGKLDFKTWAENWRFGKWLVGSEVVVYLSSLPMYMNLVGWLVGTAASGQLKAAQTLFGPTRVISYYFATVLPIQFARRLTEGGDDALRRQLWSTVLRVLPVIGGLCLLVALLAVPLLRIFFPNFAGDPSILRMYSLVSFLAYVQTVLAAALTAKQLTHYVFIGSIGGGAITLLLSYPLIKAMGIHGAMVGMLLTGLAIAALMWRGYRSSVGNELPEVAETDSK